MSSCFHKYRLKHSAEAHKDTTELLSHSLCLWLSLSKQAKQQTFCFHINVFYLFWELHISSPPQRCFKPFRDISADIWWRLEKHVGGCQAVNPGPQMYGGTLSSNRLCHWKKHRELRRNEGSFSECASNFTYFPPQAIFSLKEPLVFSLTATEMFSTLLIATLLILGS